MNFDLVDFRRNNLRNRHTNKMATGGDNSTNLPVNVGWERLKMAVTAFCFYDVQLLKLFTVKA